MNPICFGKKCYPDKKTAVSMKNFLMKKRHGRKSGARILRAYYCLEHTAWHLTSSPLTSYTPTRKPKVELEPELCEEAT